MEILMKLSQVNFIKRTYELKKICDTKNNPEFGGLLVMTLSKIFTLAGIKGTIDDVNKADILNMLLSTYNGLSLFEIHKAFEMERYSNYDVKTEHFQLFNAEYVSAVLKKYINWKREMKITYNLSPPVVIDEKTELEKHNILSEAIINRFNEYKLTATIEEPFMYLVDELINRNIIIVNEHPKVIEYYQKTFVKAQEQVKFETAQQKTFDSKDRKLIKEELEKIIKGDSSKIKIRQYRIVLADFFNKHIIEETDFETLIKN
jgi:hypothetical protein